MFPCAGFGAEMSVGAPLSSKSRDADFARSICLRSAKTHMQVRPAIPPTFSDGRTLRTGSAQSVLRFHRGTSVRLDRLRWYKHARPRCLKAHRHQGSSQADGLGRRSCPLHGRSTQSVRHEERTLSTGGSSRHESHLSRLHARLPMPWTTDALAHQRQRTIDVPLVESRVDLGYECLCVRHIVLRE